MRRVLGILIVTVVAVVTAGCGGSSSAVSQAPASDPAGSPSLTPGPVPGARVLPLISMTGAGGRAVSSAGPLDSPREVERFAEQFPTPATRRRVVDAISQVSVPAGHRLVGQVVAVGCDRPPGADVVVDKSGQVRLVPHAVASPLQECLVAVTTVALAIIPAT
jgi:hypothetical protein